MNVSKVYCANCQRLVDDEGTGKTCEYCGTSPVPSYSYPTESGFHPDNCGCAIKASTTVFRKRKLPLPTKPRVKGLNHG
jgi:hypothetical protein